MTKAEIVTAISNKTGIEKAAVLNIVEELMISIKESITANEEVYLRGFGSFIIKHRAAKVGRNISKGTAVNVPAHNIPAFKPCKEFMNEVKNKTK